MTNRANDFKVITIMVSEIDLVSNIVKYSMAFDKHKRVQKPFTALDHDSRRIVHKLQVGKKYAISQIVMGRGTGWIEAKLLDANGRSPIQHCPITEAVIHNKNHKEINNNLAELFEF